MCYSGQYTSRITVVNKVLFDVRDLLLKMLMFNEKSFIQICIKIMFIFFV